MKLFKRILAILLLAAMLTGMFSGCATKASGTDPIMTKGEFMLLFASETGITANDASEVSIAMSETSDFYEAARAIVNMGYATAEEVVKDVEYGVTKEFVATVCVRNLYFRETFDVLLKDEGKLADPQACKDAVGHGIVTAENGYFDANEEMTYVQCQAAIDRMMEIDSDGRFAKEDLEIEVELKEGVVNLDEFFNPEDIISIDPDDPAFDDIMSGFTDTASQVSSEGSYGVSLLSNRTGGNGNVSVVPLANNVCSYGDAEEGDTILIRMPAKSSIGSHLYKELKVGDFFVFGVLRSDQFNATQMGNTLAMVGVVEGISDKSDVLYTYYLVRVASNEEVMAHAKLNGYSSSSQGTEWKSEKQKSDCEAAEKKYGITVGNITIDSSGLHFSISQKFENKTDSWRDAVYSGSMTYKFDLTDIDLTCDGWGGALTGNIQKAVFRLDYTVTNTFNAKIDPLKFAPDDNRNGKFLNNVSRSRFTSANAAGADEIKIARIYANIGYGFMAEFYLYLQIHVDGSITVTIKQECQRGVKVIDNKASQIKETDTTVSVEINVNLEASVNLKIGLKWGSKKAKSIVDVIASVGVDIVALANIYVFEEGKDEWSQSYPNSNISDTELEKRSADFKMEWCFDISRSYFWRVQGLTADCTAGKVIRWFDEDFSLDSGKKQIGTTKHWHWENGKKVDACSMEDKGEENAIVQDSSSALVFDKYALVLPDNCCGIIFVDINIDGMDSLLELMKETGTGGIRIYSEDPSVADAYVSDNSICVDCHKPGATKIILETGNKRYRQECSVLVMTPEDFEAQQ